MTVRYRSATLGEFIEHHSYDVSRGGMFIKTPSPFPAGTLLKFEVKIAEEQRLMQGVGRVVWKREGDQAAENAPAGMGIKFIKIDEASHAVIERLVENRGHGGPSAFEQSPASIPPKSRRMFPEHAPSTPPPAPAEAPVPEGVTPPGVDESSSPNIESAAASDPGPSDSGALAREAKGGAASHVKGSPVKASKGPGRHWFLIALVALVVLGLFYVLTHKAPAAVEDSRRPVDSTLPDALAARAPRNPIRAC